MPAMSFSMWPYWRDKYYGPVEALKEYYPEVLAAEATLRLEVIRIEAYESLVDKLMGAHEQTLMDRDADFYPLWAARCSDRGYTGALEQYYAKELKQSEPLRVALQHIVDAKAVIDKWMTGQAAAEEEGAE